jgi:hypothetical protein
MSDPFLFLHPWRCINDLKEKLDESEVVAGRVQFLIMRLCVGLLPLCVEADLFF